MVVPGCPQRENLFSSLDAVGDWVKKGSYHTAWAVPFWFLVHLFVCLRARPRYRATHWKAVLASRSAEGHRTPDEAMVCCGRGANCREPEPLSGMEIVCGLAL